MNRVRWPAAEPAICLLAGTALAPAMSWLPVGFLVALVALGLALGRRWSRILAMVAAGTLNAAVAWVLPQRQLPPIDPERPVFLTVRLHEAWRPVRYGEAVSGWVASAGALRLRQGEWIGRGPSPLVIFVGGSEAPPSDRLLRVCGHLRRREGYAFGGPVEPGPWRMSVKSRLLVEGLRRDRLAVWSTRLRRRLVAPLERVAERRGRGTRTRGGLALTSALLLGDRRRLPDSWRDGLRRLGLSHLLAVSGLHVALLLAPLLLLTRRWGPAIELALAALVLGLYVLLVGPRPSLLRAAQMALVALAARLVRRRREAVNSLAVAVVLLVGLTPSIVQDLGFQLTVAATAGILVLVPWWGEVWPGPRAPLRRSLQVSLAAQVATLPWVLSRFGVVSPLAPLANLLAVPWAGVCLLAAVAVAALAQLSPVAAGPGLWLLDLLAVPFGWPALLEPGGTLGAVSLLVAVQPPLALACSLAVAVALRRPTRAAVILAGLLLCRALASAGGSADVEIVLLDVGQGDAILLRDGSSRILVDGGGTAGGSVARRALLPALARSGVHRLDVGILSHPDRDHCLGLLELSRYVAIGELWVPATPPRGACATALLARFAGRTRRLEAGEEATIGDWRFEVLHPGPSSPAAGNEGSLVLRASRYGVAVLLTGDVDAAVEALLVQRHGATLRSDILKVPHHGSRTSSSSIFLAAVRARVALLSVGVDNPYAHPSAEVVARYRRRRSVLLRTDRHGQVTVSWSSVGPLRLRTTGR